MKATLKKLILKNFKGLSIVVDLKDGKNTFLGANGTGKTTLADAVSWGLWGKDSQDSAKFEIKTIQDGEPVHQLEHSVLQVWEVDGKEYSFERVFSEKWTKPRGAIEKEFGGHVTDYRLNGDAKTTKRKYDDQVNELFGSEIFKLCTDIRHFSTMKWEDRRAKLIEIGNVAIDADSIIDSIDGFRPLLNGRSPEEARKIADERRAKINEEMKTLPARIDEVQQGIDKTVGESISHEQAKSAVESAKASVRIAEQKIKDFEQSGNSGELKELNQKLIKAESEFSEAKQKAEKSENDRKRSIANIDNELKNERQDLTDHEEEIEKLRTEWKAIKAEEFQEHAKACPTCGQELPEDQIEGMVEKFNQSKSERLEKNQARGKDVSKEIERIKSIIAGHEEKKAELEKIERPAIIDQMDTAEVKQLKYKIDELKKSSQKPVPDELTHSLETAQTELERAQDVEAGIRASANAQKRIEELRGKLSDYTEEFNRIEKFIFLHDQYNKALDEQTEGPVNEMFEYVNFRMFTTQVNGSIVPCCDILNDEMKPFETAMSNGERLRAGLDIVKTFQGHYGLNVPVWIDNAESLTVYPEMDCQVVELVHDKTVKTLTKEA